MIYLHARKHFISSDCPEDASGNLEQKEFAETESRSETIQCKVLKNSKEKDIHLY